MEELPDSRSFVASQLHNTLREFRKREAKLKAFLEKVSKELADLAVAAEEVSKILSKLNLPQPEEGSDDYMEAPLESPPPTPYTRPPKVFDGPKKVRRHSVSPNVQARQDAVVHVLRDAGTTLPPRRYQEPPEWRLR